MYGEGRRLWPGKLLRGLLSQRTWSRSIGRSWQRTRSSVAPRSVFCITLPGHLWGGFELRTVAGLLFSALMTVWSLLSPPTIYQVRGCEVSRCFAAGQVLVCFVEEHCCRWTLLRPVLLTSTVRRVGAVSILSPWVYRNLSQTRSNCVPRWPSMNLLKENMMQ